MTIKEEREKIREYLRAGVKPTPVEVSFATDGVVIHRLAINDRGVLYHHVSIHDPEDPAICSESGMPLKDYFDGGWREFSKDTRERKCLTCGK